MQFSFMHGMSISDWAAWTQAILSAVSIAVSAWLARRQWVKQSEIDRQIKSHEKAERMGVYIGMAEKSRNIFIRIFMALTDKENLFSQKNIHKYSLMTVQRVTQAMDSMPISDLPDGECVMAWFDLNIDSCVGLDYLQSDEFNKYPYAFILKFKEISEQMTSKISILKDRRDHYTKADVCSGASCSVPVWQYIKSTLGRAFS